VSAVLEEFLDLNLHRSYPLTDESAGQDNTGSFTIPTSLMSDIYLCVPNIPGIDVTKFFIENITIRRFFIDISLGYDDSSVTNPVGVFKNISTSAPMHSTYPLVPTEFQSGDAFTPIYHMTGQIIIGDTAESIRHLGSWSFSQTNPTNSSFIVPTRVARGLLNVQYISINGRLFTGDVKLREGTNVSMEVETETINGTVETTVTISASLNASASTQLNNDQDVLDALVSLYGQPIQSINGMKPDAARNFNIFGLDCTTVSTETNRVTISNPCATPCCDEDTNVAALLDAISNLNLRYSQLINFFDGTASSVNNIQNKLLALASEV